MGFTRAGLAIGKDTGVEAVESVFEEFDANVLEEGALLCVFVVGTVKGEGHDLFLCRLAVFLGVGIGRW